MRAFTIWRLLLEILAAPSCGGACNQGRRECKCRKR